MYIRNKTPVFEEREKIRIWFSLSLGERLNQKHGKCHL